MHDDYKYRQCSKCRIRWIDDERDGRFNNICPRCGEIAHLAPRPGEEFDNDRYDMQAHGKPITADEVLDFHIMLKRLAEKEGNSHEKKKKK
jgi:hypothetical protein